MGQAIFRFLFKYPPVAFSRGRLAFASNLPAWLVVAAIVVVTAVVGHFVWRRHPNLPKQMRLLIWGLQAGALAILLVMVARPSLIVSLQVPQQNVVAILADDSSSMSMSDVGSRRIEQIQKTLSDDGPLLRKLRENFQIRLYRFSKDAARVRSSAELTAQGPATHLQESVAQVYGELRHLPLAGLVIATDGAENGGSGSRELADDLK